MEETIKILEDFIKYFEAEAISTKYRRNISITVDEDDIQALENLLKGYRELEKENAEIKKYYINPSKTRILYYDTKKGTEVVTEGFIPKSKIKEKIEKLNDYDSEFCQRVINHNEHTLTEFVQNILQELMEDK